MWEDSTELSFCCSAELRVLYGKAECMILVGGGVLFRNMSKVWDCGALVPNRCARLKDGHAGTDQIPDSNIRCDWRVDAGYWFDRRILRACQKIAC